MTIDWDSALNAGSKVYTETQSTEDRSLLDRIFAPLGNYSIVNGLYNLTDNDPNTGFFGGAFGAIEYMNPFDNNVPEIHTTSDVLGNLGWNPTSLPGKIARGVVGFAGDVALDPLTYVNPFSSVGKIVKGTGTVVKTGKGLEYITPLTTRQAKTVVDTFYKQRGIDPSSLDINAYVKEVKDLQSSFNEKILKVKQGGEGLQFGGANIPFADKIKVGDKTLDKFTKTFVSGDKLRSIGDATIAPYYNQMATKIRNTKAMQVFNKYGDLQTLAKTNPMQVSAIMKLEQLIKGMDKTNIDADLQAMEDANFIDQLTPDEETFLKDFILSGDWKNVKIAESLIGKIRNQGIKLANQVNGQQVQKDTLQQELDKVQEQLNKLAGKMGNQPAKKSTIDNFGSQFYIDRILNHTPSAKLEVAEMDANTMFDDMINSGEYDDEIRNYMRDIVQRDRDNAEKTVPQELLDRRNEALLNYNQATKEVADNQKYRYEEIVNLIQEDVDQYNHVVETLNKAKADKKQKPRIPALEKRQKELEGRILAKIEQNGGDKSIFTNLENIKQSVKTAKDRALNHKTALSDVDEKIANFKRENKIQHINNYDDNQLLDLGKSNEEVLNAIRSNFDMAKDKSKEYEAIGFTVESKKAVVDELNHALFGETRKRPVIQYDIDDNVLENVLKAIEAKDTKQVTDLLHDSVLQHNWNHSTFDEIYYRTSNKFDFTRYGLDASATIRTSPTLKIGKDKPNWTYFTFKDMPELIAQYEMGEKKYGSMLAEVAEQLQLKPAKYIETPTGMQKIDKEEYKKQLIDNLKNVPREMWNNFNKAYNKERSDLATLTGARDLRTSMANLKATNDALYAMRQESKNPNLAELPKQEGIKYDQYFDYKDINNTGSHWDDIGRTGQADFTEAMVDRLGMKADDITEEEYQSMYDNLTHRIRSALDGRQLEQISPDELAMFKDIDQIENGKFGIHGDAITPLIGRPINDENDMIDEYIMFMKEKGKDTRYPERDINKYDVILHDLKDNGDQFVADQRKKKRNQMAFIRGLEDQLFPIQTRINAIQRRIDSGEITSDKAIAGWNKIKELQESMKPIKKMIADEEKSLIENTTTKAEVAEMLNNVNQHIKQLSEAYGNMADGDDLYTLNRYYTLEEEAHKTYETRNVLKKQMETLNQVEKVRAKLDAAVPITQIERGNFYKLSPFQQQMIARDYSKYQENRIMRVIANSDDKKLEKLIYTEKNPGIKFEYQKALTTRRTKAEQIKATEEARAKKIADLKVREADLKKQFEQFSSSDANRTAFYYLSNDYVRDQLSVQMGKTIEEVDRLMELRKNGKMIDMAKFWTDRMNEIGQKEVNIGKMKQEQFDAWKDKYIPLVVSDEGLKYFMDQVTREHNGKFNPETFGVGIRKKFDQHRTFDTIEEANREMKEKTGIDGFFEIELADIFQSRAIGHNELLFNEEMTNSIRHIFGKDYKAGETMKGYSPTITYNDLRKRMYDKYIAEGGTPGEFKISDADLVDMGINPILFSPNMQYIKLTEEQVKKIAQKTSFTKPDGTGGGGLPIFNLKDELHPRLNKESRIQKAMLSSEMVNFYDKFLHIYKMWNSAMFPGFHLQNFASNAFQSFMSSGRAILDPDKYKQAHAIFTGSTPNKSIDFQGKKLTYKQISELANKYGILDNTFFKEDIAINADAKGYLAQKGLSPKLDPTDINNFVPYKMGKEIGATIEGTQRLVLFIHNLEQGMDIPDAVADVNKFLFDYSDLTEFEKDTMKRIIPFYTYMRKNVPLQLEQMLENPALYANVNKIINNIESMSGDNLVEDKDRNEWRKDYIQMPIQIEGQNVGFNPQLPYQQLDRLSLNKLLGQTSPLIKAPIELISGEYAYTGIPIDSVGSYMASQTVPTRMLNQQTDMEGLDKSLYIAGQIAGFPTGTIQNQTLLEQGEQGGAMYSK